MKLIFYSLIFSVVFSLMAPFSSNAAFAAARSCAHPANAEKWALGFCTADRPGTDAQKIKKGDCYRKALADAKSKKPCDLYDTYKKKTCQRIVKKSKNRMKLASCLKDTAVQPFIWGR
jgi:hypothetical protein